MELCFASSSARGVLPAVRSRLVCVRGRRRRARHARPRVSSCAMRAGEAEGGDLGEDTAESMEDLKMRSEFREDVPLLNSVILTGRLGQDPNLRQVGRNMTDLCSFSLAVADDVYDANAQRTTSWFNVQVWGTSAQRAATTLRKGLRVGVTGTLSVDEWVGRDEKQRKTITITAYSFEILQSRSEIGFDAPSAPRQGNMASSQVEGRAPAQGGGGTSNVGMAEVDPF